MKAAIIIGVSDYDNLPPLPACTHDVAVIHEILKLSGSFQKIISIDGNQDSSKVKQAITAEIDALASMEIEDMLFYFTGHGDFDSSDSYLLLRDFQDSRRAQTRISNSELDDWLRATHPQTAIKIIDACHSGVSYIKGASEDFVEAILNKSGQGFGSCYFLYSSSSRQFSYQDSNLSFFTRAVARSIISHPADTMRYRDVVDFTSDEFQRNELQTPYSVSQGRSTELFCSITPEIRQLQLEKCSASALAQEEIEDIVPDKPDTTIPPTEPHAPIALANKTIQEKLLEQSKAYLSRAEAISLYEDAKVKLVERVAPEVLRDLYDLKLSFLQETDSLPAQDSIGKWIDKQGSYFATAVKVNRSYDYLAYNEGGEEYVETDYEVVVAGFTLKGDMPYNVVRLDLRARLENLPSLSCLICLIPSNRSFAALHAFVKYVESAWQQERIDGIVRWQFATTSPKIEKSLIEMLCDIISRFEDYALKIVTGIADREGQS